ncbi:hypothetical protein WMY93_021276 [Mugilogobius chulae]|uniref:Forkhead box protein M1 n=1 Tax=Mugilogobius chulae TaxID=88201 RepID=A0AAW0NG06_9GOBI
MPDGVCIMDHPSMSGTQVVVVPKTSDLQSVIGALTTKGKECGQFNFKNVKNWTAIKSSKDLECGPLDDSLTNIQWLGRMSTCSLEQHPTKPTAAKNLHASVVLESCNTQANTESSHKQPLSERPPYSYMAMIQFAINSKQNRRMTLKEIYMWIEDHFPYFRDVAKPGWKNSIRHNLSLHDMFIRETSTDGKTSFWTIRPEANRCLTLDQVYKPDFDPLKVPGPPTMLFFLNQQQKKIMNECPNVRKTQFSTERKMKPLLPRTDSYLVPIQLPASSSVYLPPSSSDYRHSISHGGKKVRIAPKVPLNDVPGPGLNVKEEAIEVPVKSTTPKVAPKRPTSSSRRKQCLAHSLNEEPVLMCHSNTFFDSGVVSDSSTFHDMPDTQWKVTPVRKQGHTVLDFSPIRTPGGPAVTPRQDYTTFSFSSTPFKDLPLFNSPRELLTASTSRPPSSPVDCPRSGCSRELLQATGATPIKHSVTEGLVLDTMNESLSKILVDISFSGLDDEDLGMANISWSEFIPQLK